MSGQGSADSEGVAESVAAGCSIRELPSRRGGDSSSSSNNNNNNYYYRSNNNNNMGMGLMMNDSSTMPLSSSDGLAVFSWGRGEDGQLGLGDTSDHDEPTYVDALRGVGVRQIACGSGHTVVLTMDGEGTTMFVICSLLFLACFFYLLAWFFQPLKKTLTLFVFVFHEQCTRGAVAMMDDWDMAIMVGNMFLVLHRHWLDKRSCKSRVDRITPRP
jgi:Regulator of chromosome condensation (RCC1) repeat